MFTDSLITLISGLPIAAVSIKAQPLEFAHWLTNSIFVGVIVAAGITWFVRRGMKGATLVPNKNQNLCELVVEFLYNQVVGIVGEKVAPRAFPLLATIFIFVLISNWFGLLPGVGTIGWDSHHASYLTVTHIETPLLRPATADLNMTLAMSLIFMVVWTWITYKEVGVMGFIKHTFGAKGGLTGIMGILISFIFLCVGVIEMVSIAFRPVSLSLRLLGNIYAGETLLHTMLTLGEKLGLGPVLSFLTSIAFPIPFYFMEILVGFLQAMVFALLCAVYIRLSATQEEGDAH
jgi:F-type H+-transporting ATPase subunit a